ncbi:MAG: hypothetical protein Q7V63_04905 [Gammaproteobacteria bacterium]|nr:hypothetical protein [Gammaproteobacteria bacterium]
MFLFNSNRKDAIKTTIDPLSGIPPKDAFLMVVDEMIADFDAALKTGMAHYNIGALQIISTLAKLAPETEELSDEEIRAGVQPAGINLQAFDLDSSTCMQGLVIRLPSSARQYADNIGSVNSNKTAAQNIHVLLGLYDVFYISTDYNHFGAKSRADRMPWFDKGDFNIQGYITTLVKLYLIGCEEFKEFIEPFDEDDCKRINHLYDLSPEHALTKANAVTIIKTSKTPKLILNILTILCGEGNLNLENISHLYKCTLLMKLVSTWKACAINTIKLIDDGDYTDHSYLMGLHNSINKLGAITSLGANGLIDDIIAHQKSQLTESIQAYRDLGKKISALDRLHQQKMEGRLGALENLSNKIKYSREQFEVISTKIRIRPSKSEIEAAKTKQPTPFMAPSIVRATASASTSEPRRPIIELIRRASTIIIGCSSTLRLNNFFPSDHFDKDSQYFGFEYDIDKSHDEKGFVLGIKPDPLNKSHIFKFTRVADLIYGPHTDLVTGETSIGCHPAITKYLGDLKLTLLFYLHQEATPGLFSIPKLNNKKLKCIQEAFPEENISLGLLFLHKLPFKMNKILMSLFGPSPKTKLAEIHALWSFLNLVFESENKWQQAEDETKKLIDAKTDSPAAIYRLFNHYEILASLDVILRLAEDRMVRVRSEITDLEAAITKIAPSIIHTIDVGLLFSKTETEILNFLDGISETAEMEKLAQGIKILEELPFGRKINIRINDLRVDKHRIIQLETENNMIKNQIAELNAIKDYIAKYKESADKSTLIIMPEPIRPRLATTIRSATLHAAAGAGASSRSLSS